MINIIVVYRFTKGNKEEKEGGGGRERVIGMEEKIPLTHERGPATTKCKADGGVNPHPESGRK